MGNFSLIAPARLDPDLQATRSPNRRWFKMMAKTKTTALLTRKADAVTAEARPEKAVLGPMRYAS
jgi:hypothetical protein